MEPAVGAVATESLAPLGSPTRETQSLKQEPTPAGDALLPFTPPPLYRQCFPPLGAAPQSPVLHAAATFRRSPVKVGYLFKQSSGSWKRKRWNQRWFVLDTDTGVFKYFRHESLPEAVPFRQDAHGVIQLKQPDASLVIQGDLPRGVPTPFCFTVFDGSRSFLMCADTKQEFREWTSTIAAILSPRKASVDPATAAAFAAATSSSGARLASDQKIETPVANDVASMGSDSSYDETLEHPPSPIQRPAPVLYEQDDERPTVKQTLVALVILNPFVAVVRYGSVWWLYGAIGLLNVFLVWVLWFQKPPPPAYRVVGDYASSETFAASSDGSCLSRAMTSSMSASSSSAGLGRSSSGLKSDSPRKTTLPRIEKLSSASNIQQTKFRGIVNGSKARAGESVKMCPPAPAAIVTGCWTQISGTRFQVRQGPNYRRTKLKAPSDESLLDLVAVDIYRSPAKIDNVASIIDLGELKSEDSPLDLFVVNCQVPSYQPSNPLWGEKQGNGEGFNFVCYFAIPPSVREQMTQSEPASQAVRLLKNFMHDTSTVRDRFKAIGIVVNPQEQKLGRTERHLLETYNGQPILTRPQHRFYRGQGYFEVDVDAHEFNYVARKGLVGVSEHFRNMVVDFGYVIEGQEDSELPEQILGAVRLCKIDVRQALEIS